MPSAGDLLLATPALEDPNFADTVVLLLEVNADGALGVILNRPSRMPLPDVLEQWDGAASDPAVMFRGGPVGLDGALGVGVLRNLAQSPLGWQEVVPGLGVVDLGTPTEVLDDALLGMRVYAGYAGWDADQLRDEIAEGSWDVAPSVPSDWLRTDTTSLLKDVLRRQPGMVAWRVNRPADPEMN